MANFLLIHGAGTGGWLWDAEAAVLRDRGHTVLAPTLTGVGNRATEGGPDTNLSTHVDEVVALIDADPRPAGSWRAACLHRLYRPSGARPDDSRHRRDT